MSDSFSYSGVTSHDLGDHSNQLPDKILQVSAFQMLHLGKPCTAPHRKYGLLLHLGTFVPPKLFFLFGIYWESFQNCFAAFWVWVVFLLDFSGSVPYVLQQCQKVLGDMVTHNSQGSFKREIRQNILLPK